MWGRVNDDSIFIFWINYPLKLYWIYVTKLIQASVMLNNIKTIKQLFSVIDIKRT